MARLTHLCMLVLLTCYILTSCTTRAQNPGLQIRVLQSGLNRAAQIMMDQVDEQVRTDGISNLDGSSGSASYSFSSIRVTSFTKPGSSVVVDGNSGVTWHASNGGLSIAGDWRYRVKKWGIRVRDSGHFTASVNGISFSISAKLSKLSNGALNVANTGCHCSMNKPSIRVSGSFFSIVYNALLRWARGKLRSSLERSMCRGAVKAINVKMNQRLAQLNLQKNINGGRMVLDYNLVSSPRFGTGYMQMQHKGEIRSLQNAVPYPAAPGIFPEPSSALPRMVYIWGSDYLINSYAFTVFHQNRIQKQLTAQRLPSDLRTFMRTSCSDDRCIGGMFPEVSQRYPNREISLGLKATSPPLVHTSPHDIEINIPGELAIIVQADSGQQVPLFGIALNLTMLLDVALSNNVVRAHVIGIRMCVSKLKDSFLDYTPPDRLQTVLNELGSNYIVPNINELGQNGGIELPHMSDTKLVRPVLQKFEGGLMFAVDIDWSGGSAQTPATPSGISRTLPACKPFTQTTIKPTTQPTTTTTTRPITTTTRPTTTTTTKTPLIITPLPSPTTTPSPGVTPSTTIADTRLSPTPSNAPANTGLNKGSNMESWSAKTIIIKPLAIGVGLALALFLVTSIFLIVFACYRCKRKTRVQSSPASKNNETSSKSIPTAGHRKISDPAAPNKSDNSNEYRNIIAMRDIAVKT